jgi:transposase
MSDPSDVKARFLADHQALHSRPEQIRDALFQQGGFFDPRDLVQVRYEMLRRHLVDRQPVTEVIQAFGMSRQMFYVLLDMFHQQGLLGLLPRKRGPKGAHKCTDKILRFVTGRQQQDPDGSLVDLAKEVKRKFGVRLHSRTLERGLSRHQKKLLRRKQPVRK